MQGVFEEYILVKSLDNKKPLKFHIIKYFKRRTPMKKTIFSNTLVAVTCLLMSSCAPLLVGGGALVGASAVKDKGITGSLSDTNIANSIRTSLYQNSPTLFRDVSVTVQNGEVSLTGNVKTEEQRLEAARVAWNTQHVHNVINHIRVDSPTTAGQDAEDILITSRIKGSLLFDSQIRSVNYSIKTVDGIVYLTGTAQNQEELNRVANHARNTPGVKRVISDVHVKNKR